MQCDGFGYCLTNSILICDNNCSFEECPNFELCNNKEPLFILHFNGGVCNECITKFGPCSQNSASSNPILVFEYEDKFDCPICFKLVDLKVKNPRCNHFLCISCMKAIYYSEEENYPNKPIFPHPKEEQDYYMNPDWYINDESVNKWKKDMGSWNKERVEYIINNTRYLKHCPICRK